MTVAYKQVASWLIFGGSVLYGVWAFMMLASVIFILGDSDTGLAMLAFFVWGLAPLPASFVALRWRRIGAAVFAAVATLFATGMVDDQLYSAARGFETFNALRVAGSLVLPELPLVLFALFYLVVGFRKWPRIWFASGTSGS